MYFPPIKFYKCSQGTLSLSPSWSLLGRLFSYIRAISNPLWGISHLYKIRNTFLRENFFGRSLTPLFQLLIDYFFNRFPMFWKKMKKTYVFEFWNFCPTNHRILHFCALQTLSSLVSSFTKRMVTFEIITATDPFIQNIYFASIYSFSALNTMLSYVRHFSGKIGAFFHMLYLWNEFGEPHFFPFLTQVIVIIWRTAAIGWKTWMY